MMIGLRFGLPWVGGSIPFPVDDFLFSGSGVGRIVLYGTTFPKYRVDV